MNTEDKTIEKLTRDLMQHTIEEPASTLQSKIMSLVIQEQTEKRKVQLKNFPIRWILGGIVAYLIVAIGGVGFFMLHPDSLKGSIQMLMDIFPVLITVLGGFSFLFFLTQLDNWLRFKDSSAGIK